MLLQQLEAYAGRLDLPPRLYVEGPLRYVIDLDGEGRLLSPTPIDLADASSPRTKRGVRRLLPSVMRSSADRASLLADKADYVLGFDPDPARGPRAVNRHQLFTRLIDRCYEQTREPSVGAVRRFLAGDPLAQLTLQGLDASGIMTFRVDGVFPIDLPVVQSFWAAENDPALAGAPVMQCIICGQERPAMERLELKLKGVPGGQTSGTSLISFNADAFQSYGLSASLNAPTCADCSERFTKAANDLLGSYDSSIRLTNVAYIFWSRLPGSNLPFAAILNEDDPARIRALYESAFSAQPGATHLDEDRFYAAALSGSGGRAVVRDWIDTTVAEAKAQLSRWFSMQRIIYISKLGPDTSPPPLPLRQLAYATVRSGDRNAAPPATVSRALLRTALTGAPLPMDLLYQAVRRCRAEQSVKRERATLIKMVLLSQRPDAKESDMVELDESLNDPGYLCGRLLAVLEQAQRAALPGVNATIVDRFYGTASSAPGSVFGRLLRGVQPHLARLERDRRGAWVAIQRRLEEVQANLNSFPRTLTLEQQGLFALGYYHERARRWVKADSDQEDSNEQEGN